MSDEKECWSDKKVLEYVLASIEKYSKIGLINDSYFGENDKCCVIGACAKVAKEKRKNFGRDRRLALPMYKSVAEFSRSDKSLQEALPFLLTDGTVCLLQEIQTINDTCFAHNYSDAETECLDRYKVVKYYVSNRLSLGEEREGIQ